MTTRRDPHPPSKALSRRDQAMARIFELRTIPLFVELTTEELLPIAYAAEERDLAKGTRIDPDDDRLFVVVRGRAELLDDADHPITEVGPGECFGEMTLLDAGGTGAALVVDDLRALTLSREVFDDLLELHPAIGRGAARVLVERLRTVYEG